MKKLIVCLSVLALFLGFGGMARAETFNFDRGLIIGLIWDGTGLRPNANATQISSYMTGIYGSPVTVAATGSPESNGIFDFLLGGFTDGYIESEPDNADQNITISFSAPITSVSFDWARSSDPFYADYSVNGTNWINFFSKTSGSSSGSTSFNLPDTVIALKFHDNGSGEVAIDNLVVEKSTQGNENPVPEPATMLLLGSGLVGLAGFARRKFRRT